MDCGRVRSSVALKVSAIFLPCFALGYWGGAVLRRGQGYAGSSTSFTPVPSAPEVRVEVPASSAKVSAVDPTKPSVERRLRDFVQGSGVKSTKGMFEGWSAVELEQAAEVILKCRRNGEEDAHSMTQSGYELVAAWARRDASAALAWVKRYPYWRERSFWEGQIYGVLAETDPEAVFKAIADHPNQVANEERILGCLSVWSRNQPHEAIDWFMTHPELHWSPVAAGCVAGGGNQDWKKRWNFVQQQPEGPAKWMLEKGLFRYEWERNKEVLLIGLEEARQGRMLMEMDFHDITDPALLSQLWELVDDDLPPSYQSRLAVAALRGMVDERTVTQALPLLSTPLSGVQEMILLARLGGYLGSLSGTVERQRFLEKIPSEEVRNLLLAEATQQQAMSIGDPFSPPGSYIDNSLSLLGLQGNETLKNRDLMRFGSAWVRVDETKAVQWIQTLPSAVERDWATTGLVAKVAEDNPTDALNWLRLIQSQEARTAATKTIAVRWLKKDGRAESGRKKFERWPGVTMKWFKSEAGAIQAWMNAQRLSPADLADIQDAVLHGSGEGAFKPDGGWTSRP